MYRLLVPALASVLLVGCGMGGSSLSSAFTDDDPTGALPSSHLALNNPDGVADRPASAVASAEDKAPKGTFAKAPRGALADRDYGATALDPNKARDLINAYRKQRGLKPLKLNAALTEAAKVHCRDLAKWDRISHYGSDGSNPWDRVKRAGYHPKLAAENVGTGQATIEEVMKGWETSPGHNKNLLLADAEQMGIALVQDPKTEFKTFWTLVVGSSL